MTRVKHTWVEGFRHHLHTKKKVLNLYLGDSIRPHYPTTPVSPPPQKRKTQLTGNLDVRGVVQRPAEVRVDPEPGPPDVPFRDGCLGGIGRIKVHDADLCKARPRRTTRETRDTRSQRGTSQCPRRGYAL